MSLTTERILAEKDKVTTRIDDVQTKIKSLEAKYDGFVNMDDKTYKMYENLVDEKEQLLGLEKEWVAKLPSFSYQGIDIIVLYVF